LKSTIGIWRNAAIEIFSAGCARLG